MYYISNRIAFNDFDVIYNYLFQTLIQANVKKDPEILEEALVQLRDLRNMWKEIMKVARIPSAMAR